MPINSGVSISVRVCLCVSPGRQTLVQRATHGYLYGNRTHTAIHTHNSTHLNGTMRLSCRPNSCCHQIKLTTRPTHIHTHFLDASWVTESPGAVDIMEHQTHLLYESSACKNRPRGDGNDRSLSFIRDSPVQITVYRNHSGPVAQKENTYSQSSKHNPRIIACSKSLYNNH